MAQLMSFLFFVDPLFLQVRAPDNDKEMRDVDALSLIILELNYSRPHDSKHDDVKVSKTFQTWGMQALLP